MTTKFITLISVIGLVSICLGQAQSPTPGESPEASPSPAESPTASPSPAKKAEATATASPSPKEKRTGKKGKLAASPAPSPSPATRGGPGMVWVSTDTRVYYREGSRFYGKTKNGKYMSEADARKEGNRLAREDNY